jgi:hypothetical protein
VQVEIEHLDVASVVKISFLIYAVMGIVVGVVYVLVVLVVGGIVGDEVLGGGGAFGLAATGLGLLLVPVLALVYGLIGAIGGVIFSVVYNVLAKAIGGIRITLKDEVAGHGIAQGMAQAAPRGAGGVEGQTEVRL